MPVELKTHKNNPHPVAASARVIHCAERTDRAIGREKLLVRPSLMSLLARERN